VRARPYAEVLGSIKGLRRGITTGTCAQAAARAAALALIGQIPGAEVEIELPLSSKPYSQARILVPIAFVRPEGDGVRAGIRKDAGDDEDATDGLVIEAFVRLANRPGVEIEGGIGVGRVTRPGLPVKPGLAAINPTPRSMIGRDLAALAPEGRGFSVLIEIPGGEAVAERTWNPRIGVAGGLSVIGTSGVVEPKSSAAFKKTIVRAARSIAACGNQEPYLTPGYVGEAYLRAKGVRDEEALVVGDHVGLGLRALAHYGAKRIILVGHAGKLVKVSAGLFNTHSRFGDARLETLAALAAAEGADRELVSRILCLGTAEEASKLIIEAGLESAFAAASRRAALRSRILCGIPVEVVMLALDGTILGSGSSEDEEAKGA
jgi:cobalt-precorrin-5B (C1)-methyltransferase